MMMFHLLTGKSSLLTALFRLTEKSGGSIDIDGVDVSQVSLEQLRSRLSIITQDPVLFSGTIRYISSANTASAAGFMLPAYFHDLTSLNNHNGLGIESSLIFTPRALRS